MATIDKSSTPEKMTDLEYAIHLIITGRKDPEFQAKACERMDRMREMMQETNLAVELIREGRDEE
jgi:hypothetical protein